MNRTDTIKRQSSIGVHYDISSTSASPPLIPTPTKKLNKKSKTKTRQKEKGKPKRPLSAYNLFFEEIRSQLLRERGSTSGFKDLALLVSAKWNEITKSTDPKCIEVLEKLKSKASQLKKDYFVQVEAWRAQKEEQGKQRSVSVGSFDRVHSFGSEDGAEQEADIASTVGVSSSIGLVAPLFLVELECNRKSPPYIPEEIKCVTGTTSSTDHALDSEAHVQNECFDHKDSRNVSQEGPFTREELEMGLHFDNDRDVLYYWNESGSPENYSSFTSASTACEEEEDSDDHYGSTNISSDIIPQESMDSNIVDGVKDQVITDAPLQPYSEVAGSNNPSTRGPSDSTLAFLLSEFDQDGIEYLRSWLL